MFYRRLHWVLAAVVLAVGLIQILTGNLPGAILPLLLAAVFASIAADYPIIRGARRIWRWLRRLLWVLVALHLPAAEARADEDQTLTIIYNGVGTTSGARVWGRVVEYEASPPPKEGESKLEKAWRSFKYFETDEVPNASVGVDVPGGGGERVHARSDGEGFFTVDLKGPLKRGRFLISGSARRLKEPPKPVPVSRPGWVHIVPARPGVAVISDMDDTLLRTGVSNKARMIKRVIFSNAHDLRAFSNAPALYKVWADRGYPIVFVSGSPYNLYTRLFIFLQRLGLQTCAMRLKDFGTDALTEQVAYKVKRIDEIMALLPGYRFILVGDSGEKDPEIYRAVKEKYPGRIIATLIHRVSNEQMRSPRFKGQLLFNFYSGLARKLGDQGLFTAEEVKRVETTP